VALTGSISGSVQISAALTTRRPRFRVYAEPGATVPPEQRTDIPGERRNVVVYLDSDAALDIGAAEAARQSRGVIAQTSERFEPHVLPVLTGSRVEFPNNDDVYHNVFSLSSARTFDLGRYPKGSSKSVTFGRTGVVQIFCHIHADMSAVVLVLPNPFFIRPDSSGRYTIQNVPAGEYTIVGWHERTRPVSQRVRVVAGQSTNVDFNLPLSQPAPGSEP
jgi:plastocyanin